MLRDEELRAACFGSEAEHGQQRNNAACLSPGAWARTQIPELGMHVGSKAHCNTSCDHPPELKRADPLRPAASAWTCSLQEGTEKICAARHKMCFSSPPSPVSKRAQSRCS